MLNRIESHQSAEPACVVGKFECALHEDCLPEDQRKRKHRRVKRNGDQCLQYAQWLQSMIALRKDSTHDAAPDNEPAPPAHRRYHFVGGSLVAPDECVPLGDLASEEILVFAGQSCGIEWFIISCEQRLLQKNVAGAAFSPRQNHAGRMDGPLIQPALDHP